MHVYIYSLYKCYFCHPNIYLYWIHSCPYISGHMDCGYLYRLPISSHDLKLQQSHITYWHFRGLAQLGCRAAHTCMRRSKGLSRSVRPSNEYYYISRCMCCIHMFISCQARCIVYNVQQYTTMHMAYHHIGQLRLTSLYYIVITWTIKLNYTLLYSKHHTECKLYDQEQIMRTMPFMCSYNNYSGCRSSC